METTEMPCENCGKPVTVLLPFIGCVFCAECAKSKSVTSWEANDEQFKQPFRTE
jgi:hypothetical protein